MNNLFDDLGILAIGTRFRGLGEAMWGIVKAFYDEHQLDFEPRCFPLFNLIRRQPDVTMMVAAHQLGVSHAAINALCKPLLDKGFIAMVPDPKDARAKQMRLTGAGEVMFARLEPAWAVLKRGLNEALADGQAEAILNTLAIMEEVVADKAFERGIKRTLKPDAVAKGLEIVAYDPEKPDHKRYFTALNTEWLEQYFQVEAVDQAMFADPKATFIDKGGFIVMAAWHGQIVGTGAVIKRAEGYELAKMAVSKVFQGRGIGVQIVRVLLDEARLRGITTMYLVSSTILPHAVRMYRKLGFTDSALALHALYERSDITLEKDLTTI